MESIQLSVKGMKCGGCVSTVEKILNNSDGIENVSVNLLTESAYFEITQKNIEIEAILKNLKENGFPSKIYINDFSKKINKAELEKKKKWNKQWKKLTFDLLLFFFSGLGCLLYTSDAADDSLRVDLGGRRIIKKTRKTSSRKY